MAIQTTAGLSPRALKYYSREILETSYPVLTYALFGEKKPMKENNGDTIDFARYDKLAPATTPLTEGVTPTGTKIYKHEVTATLYQYGDWTGVTDVVTLINFDPEITKAVEALGKQQGLTLDTLLRDVLLQGTNEYYAGDVASRTLIAKKLQKLDIQRIVRSLEGNDVEKITTMIEPSTGVATSPVEEAYIAIAHTDLGPDLRDLVASGDFVPIHKYSKQQKVFKGEVGILNGVRFILTSNAPVIRGAGTAPESGVLATNNKTDVYQVVIFGKGAYAEVPLNKGNSGIILKVKAKGDTHDSSDPLNQRNTAGWKCMWAGLILDDSRLVRYECGVKE